MSPSLEAAVLQVPHSPHPLPLPPHLPPKQCSRGIKYPLQHLFLLQAVPGQPGRLGLLLALSIPADEAEGRVYVAVVGAVKEGPVRGLDYDQNLGLSRFLGQIEFLNSNS